MKKFIYLACTILMLSCNSNGNNNLGLKAQKANTVQTSLQDSLAFKLCEMYGLDQGIRKREIYSQLNKKLSVKIDSLNFFALFDIIKKHGYPNKKLLGEDNLTQDCVAGAPKAILLHNPYRLLSDRPKIKLLVKEADKGNLDREFIATVLDKYFWWKSGGKEVLYGSAFGMPCISTKAKTNILRKEIGLLPLADSLFIDCSKK